MQDYFSLLNMPQHFELDQTELESSYDRAIAGCHPDRFSGDLMLIKQAQEMAAKINRAWHTLADPLKRAQHMLELAGVYQQEHTTHDSEFLMMQMQWREKIEDAEDKLKQVYAVEIKQHIKTTIDSLAKLFAGSWQQQQQLEQIQQLLARLQFWNKLRQQLDG